MSDPTIEAAPGGRRHPEWLKVRAPSGEAVHDTKRVIRGLQLHTVCEEARCPNVGECWGHRTATFMLMGEVCTRNCGFCAVTHGRPATLDPDEPRRVAQAVAQLNLRHVVVTSVDRDDLQDGGAQHFADTACAIKAQRPDCRVELLIPDFQGDQRAIDTATDAPIDVLNHNLETVPRLYRRVRPGSHYQRSLALLQRAHERRPGLLTKTGLMLGLGEQRAEMLAVFADLQAAGCAILTLGQYLRPSAEHLPVERYVPPPEFAELGRAAAEFGFRHVESGPLVRSSYHAWKHVG
ncbi:MAG: lipoyl synthase [Deltaproteobacteria bacterium]|nr:lipoyl synthase [Deltaproteobacteria bacterium]